MTAVQASSTHPLYAQLRAVVGEDLASDGPIIVSAYSRDACHLTAERPGIVVMPRSVEDVQAIVRLCAETKTPLVPDGGRNGTCGACLPCVGNAVMLDMAKLDNVVRIDEDVMTVTVEPGLRWTELIHRLDEKCYKLGFREPYGSNVGTVGGSTSIDSILREWCW